MAHRRPQNAGCKLLTRIWPKTCIHRRPDGGPSIPINLQMTKFYQILACAWFQKPQTIFSSCSDASLEAITFKLDLILIKIHLEGCPGNNVPWLKDDPTENLTQGGIRQENIGRASTKQTLTIRNPQVALFLKKIPKLWGGSYLSSARYLPDCRTTFL